VDAATVRIKPGCAFARLPVDLLDQLVQRLNMRLETALIHVLNDTRIAMGPRCGGWQHL
jgi:hypothetical protein